MKQSRFTDSQIISILKANEAGAKVAKLSVISPIAIGDSNGQSGMVNGFHER